MTLQARAENPASLVLDQLAFHTVPPALDARILDARGLLALPAADWDQLAANALEDNPFFSRQVVEAGIAAMGDGRGMEAIVIVIAAGDRLAAVFPFRRFWGWPATHGRPAANLYQVNGTPLIDRELAGPVLARLMRMIASDPSLPSHWVFPHIPLAGAFAARLDEAAGAEGMVLLEATSYQRPVLTRAAGSFAQHVETVIGRKRAKDVVRNIRRLEAIGDLAFERTDEPATVKKRIEAFLKIEDAGWKGKRGTSFLANPAHAAFARAAFAPEDGGSRITSVDSLLLDGEPIAISVNMATGDTLFTPKCAFDETYRKFGVGMALEYKVIEAFFAQNRFAEMDAATTVGGHIIEGFWGSSTPMGTLVLGRDDVKTRALRSALVGYAAGKAKLKALLRRG